MIVVSRMHSFASKKDNLDRRFIWWNYNEVSKGDSTLNDKIRRDIETNHLQIKKDFIKIKKGNPYS